MAMLHCKITATSDSRGAYRFENVQSLSKRTLNCFHGFKIKGIRNLQQSKVRKSVVGGAQHPELVSSSFETSIEQNFVAEICQSSSLIRSESSAFSDKQYITAPSVALALGGLALAGYGIKKIFDTPSRTYDENVGEEYDAWTEEGILEYYWGEHIHLGYYTKEERKEGYKKQSFIEAKYKFIDEMLKWCGVESPKTIIDVGCGIGGTSRYLAKQFPDAEVVGITLSPNQVNRGKELALAQDVHNVDFKVMNALSMDYPDNSFDLVWACESGEHMPDKRAYVEEMVRVLKPGGKLVIATWCQRDAETIPLTDNDKERLQFLYDEWAHPYFISKEEYGRIGQATAMLDDIVVADWTAPTIDSWRHSIWVGVWDPWIVVMKGPRAWYKVLREIVTLERMHRAFADGLMEYGMMKAVKAEQLVQSPEVKVEIAD
jgi:MPBQ/MSBQ methyltransferase